MNRKKDSNKTLEDALIDLYLNVKIRKQDEIENMNTLAMNEEKENLKNQNPLTIMEYIKSSIDILIDLKVEERLENIKRSSENDDENDYESLLRKLESDIRAHIRMEHQLKLHSESLQSRIDELEKENSDAEIKSKTMSDKINQYKKTDTKDKKEFEINNLKSEIINLKHILKSYEEQSHKLTETEKKLRNQNTKHEKEMKILEEKYKDKIRLFSKKLSSYEEMMKVNNSSFKSFKRDVSIREDDDLDRVNYNDQSQSHSQDQQRKGENTYRKSPNPITDRIVNRNEMQNKIDHYKKIIDKKINEISTTSNKNINKSGLGDSNTTHTNDRSSSNHSFITKALENDASKSHRKNDSLIKNLDSATKKILSKDNYKTHNRHSSMEIKYTAEGKIGSVQKSLNSTNALNGTGNANTPVIKNTNLTKNIHAMKEMLFNNNTITNSHSHMNGAIINNPKVNNSKNKQQHATNPGASNIILNQSGIPCYNNINIYTTNNSNNIKANEINLRQYIFNKVNKPKSMTKIPGGHVRSTSNNNH